MKVHFKFKNEKKVICGAGSRWNCAVISSVSSIKSDKINCKSCIKQLNKLNKILNEITDS